MTARSGYLAGVAAVLGVGVVGALAAAAPARQAMLLALATAGIAQGPLGWWLVRSVGTDRFRLIWGIGIGVRFLLFAALAFGFVPAAGVPAVPALVTYVLTVMALLLVEALVAHTAHG